jgi:hypothetical protein
MARAILRKVVKAVWGRQNDQMKQQLNNVQDELSALYAKLDADVGVTDVNYAATLEPMSSKIG